MAPPSADRVGPVAEATVDRTGTLDVLLFGVFEVSVDGRAVPAWHGRRGVEVLRYLMARPRYAASRDELLEEFWPGVAPEVARNRLQVAVSGVRRVLVDITPRNVVEFADGSYRIHPELRVDTDVDRFERALSRARSAERAGDDDGALAGYRDVLAEYRGDFAADSPYGNWTLLPRETLRLSFIDALDRMSRILLRTGRASDCVATALRMLDLDPFREDAHRMLMRCYAHDGRTYQALRQYELCRSILAATLDVRPEPRTTRLYDAIRVGSAREPTLTE